LEPLLETVLMANDLIVLSYFSPEHSNLQKAARTLPLANYLSRGTYPRDLGRNLIIFEEIAPALSGTRRYRDIETDFLKATGVTPQVFCELAFVASTKNLSFKQTSEGGFALKRSNLAHQGVTFDEIDAFFEKSSIGIEELQAKVRGRPPNPLDFRLLQRNPLVRIGSEGYICSDGGFLLDKLGKGLYWTLHDAQPSSQRHALLTYWSALIEQHVHWLFGKTYRGKGVVTESPCFSNGDEVSDVLVKEGSSLIIIEVKASVMTAEAKYSLSAETLGDELHRKVITGENGERKGVARSKTVFSACFPATTRPE
jgi:hypothetical protein